VLHVLTDLFALSTLRHAAGGLRRGLGVLVIVAVAGAAVVSTRRLAALFAAVATLLVLGETAWPVLSRPGDGGSLALAGFVGIACFATAMTINWLATRLHAQEQIARRRGEDLRLQLALTSRVVSEVEQGVLIVDGKGAIRTMNPAARMLLGIGDGETAGARLPMVLHDAYTAWRAQPARSVEREFSVTGGDRAGARVPLRLRFLSASEPGTDTVVMIEDQRRIEERAQQLKLASMGRLSASIAHEIRNPLAAIRHANSLLAEQLPEPALARLAGIVEANTVRIDRIIEDVLSIARRERAAVESIDLAAFLKTLLPEFVAASGADPRRIEVRLESEQPIPFDSNHLRQVLLNLLSNALRYASTGEAAVVIGWRQCAPHRLELTVADDGPGLAPEMLEHVFEPFFTTDHRGTGLGLYLARELCAANAATIRYDAARPPQRRRGAFVIELAGAAAATTTP
ncbi:MAG: nitrogen regulation protein NR(II), partial [Burkholderiaceae bacterium]